jgi:5-methylcytosine-specific restriction endonuclease McrA
MPPIKKALRTQLYKRDGRKCHYCGIDEKDFFSIWGEFYGSKRRGSTLEVDRKDNSRGYEIDNCVLACAVCNNAKSDKFSYDEFKRVGEVIKGIWQSRKLANNLE